MALSTTKSEYMVLVQANKEIILMRDFINGLEMGQEQIHNQSIIHIAKNIAYNSRAKHIQQIYHWLRERIEERGFTLVKVHMNDNGLDMLTKVLSMDEMNACL